MGTSMRSLTVVAAVAAAANTVSAAMITLTYGVDGYSGAADTSVMSFRPDFDASGLASLTVADWHIGHGGQQQRVLRSQALVSFDLTDVLPNNAIVRSAKLSLFVASATPNAELGVFNMDRAWTDQSTWNTLGQPVVPGPSAPPVDHKPVGGRTQRNTFVDFDVTSSVDSWVRGLSVNHGWAIATRNQNVAVVRSMQAAASQRPTLSIQFDTVPEPATLALLATAGLLTLRRRDA